jgi:hypothetical protein
MIRPISLKIILYRAAFHGCGNFNERELCPEKKQKKRDHRFRALSG